jgi:DNA-directed RNA polymerase specialized sigma24 family protein
MDRNALILAHWPAVQRLARRYRWLNEDAAQDGAVGLIEAADRYVAEKQAHGNFWAFAVRRIRGAMIAGVRQRRDSKCGPRYVQTFDPIDDVFASTHGHPDRAFAQMEAREDVDRLARRAEMAPSHRLVLDEWRLTGDVADAADELWMPVTTVYTYKSAAVRALKAALLLVALIACLAQRGDAAPARVLIWYPPLHVWDDEPTTYQVRVPPAVGNRWLLFVAYDGDLEVRHSEESLTDRGPALFNFAWQLPVCDCELIAALYDAQGRQLGKDHRTIAVRNRANPDF